MSPELHSLNKILDTWQRWFRFRRGTTWAARGLAGGLAVGLLVAAYALPRAWLLPTEYLRLVSGLALSGLFMVGLAGYLWPFPRLQAARGFDRRFGLRERVTTALELADLSQTTPIPDGLRTRQLEDALSAARQVQVRRQLPLSLPRLELLLILVLVGVLALVAWRAQPLFAAALHARQVQAAIQQEIQRLETLKDAIEKDNRLTPEQQAELTRPLEDAIQALKDAQTPEQAVSVLTTAQKELRALAESPAAQQAAALQETGQALASQDGSPLQATGQALAQIDPETAAQTLQNLDLSQLSPEAQQALAQQLQAAAQALSNKNPQLAQQLQSAATALQQGDLQAAQQALQSAAQSLSQNATGLKAAQAQAEAAQQAAAQISQGQGALAQSASPGQNPGQGQTTGQNQGSGSSTAQGGQAGTGGAGRGESTGNPGQGPEAGSNPIGQNNGPGDGGERAYETIYAPERLGGESGPQVGLASSGQPGGQVTGQGETQFGQPGTSQVPYVEVFPSYAEAYRQAIESGQVPASLRALVKDYFSSLQP